MADRDSSPPDHDSLSPPLFSETPSTMSPRIPAEVLREHQEVVDWFRSAGGFAKAAGDEENDDDFEDIDDEEDQGGVVLGDGFYRPDEQTDRLHALNPYKQALNVSDLESCVVLENSCFPPELAATRDKILYRLRKANPLCIGLFTTVNPDDENTSLLTYNTSRPAETGSSRRAVLMAHILVTLTTNLTVKEEDMALPPDWKEPNPKAAPELGHKVHGRTLAIHSVAVLPELQRARLGTTLLRSFIQMVKDAKVADRISLLTYERLVPWYSEFGFTSSGKSSNQHGGEDWYDLVLEFQEDDDSNTS